MSSTLIQCPNCRSTYHYTAETQPAAPAAGWEGREVKQIHGKNKDIKESNLDPYLPNKIAKGTLQVALLTYGLAVILFACAPYWVAVVLLGGLIGFVAIKVHRVLDLLGILEPGPIKYENAEKL